VLVNLNGINLNVLAGMGKQYISCCE